MAQFLQQATSSSNKTSDNPNLSSASTIHDAPDQLPVLTPIITTAGYPITMLPPSQSMIAAMITGYPAAIQQILHQHLFC